MALRAELRKAISLFRPILAVPSALGAGYIVQHIARSPKRRKRVFTRIMLGMSLHDLILAVVYMCYKLPVPAEASRGSSTMFAVGSWASCDAFGMLFEGSRLTSILYNACLTQYYVLTIRYQWSEWKCRKKAELWLHLIPLIYGWIPAIVGIPLQAYAPVSFGCAVRSYPPGCRFKDPSTCIRGGKISSKIYSLAFLFAPLWLVFLYTVVALYLIYRQIASVEAASQRFSMKQLRSQELVSGNNSTTFHNTGDEPGDSSSGGRRRQSKEVVASVAAAAKKRSLKQKFAAQALLYCLAFFVTWIFASINGGRALIGNKKTFPAVAMLNAIFTPLQGFWNALIYIWPRYRRYREKQLKEHEEAQERQRRRQQRQQRQQEQEQPQQQQQQLPVADVAEAQGQAHDTAATIVHPGNRMTAMLQAISVAAEDDEDDYEYIIFGSMATSGAETAEDENDSDNDQEKREAGRRASF